MMLSALNLKGRPAAKDLTAVAQIWYGLMSRQAWQPPRDIPRIRAAFETIAATQTEWPNPADLTKNLPAVPVKMVPKLEKKHVRTEYGKAQMAALKQKMAELKNAPCMNRGWIYGERHRSAEECRRIYEMQQRKKEKQHD